MLWITDKHKSMLADSSQSRKMRECEGGQFPLPAFLFLLMLTLTSQDAMLMDKTKRHTAGPRSISQPPEARGAAETSRRVTEVSPPIRSSPQQWENWVKQWERPQLINNEDLQFGAEDAEQRRWGVIIFDDTAHVWSSSFCHSWMANGRLLHVQCFPRNQFSSDELR